MWEQRHLCKRKRQCGIMAHHVRADTDPSASRNSSLHRLAFHENMKTPIPERLLTHEVVTQKLLVFSYVCQSRLFLSVPLPPSPLPSASFTNYGLLMYNYRVAQLVCALFGILINKLICHYAWLLHDTEEVWRGLKCSICKTKLMCIFTKCYTGFVPNFLYSSLKQKQTTQNYLKRRDEEKKNLECEVQTSDCNQTWHEACYCAGFCINLHCPRSGKESCGRKWGFRGIFLPTSTYRLCLY